MFRLVGHNQFRFADVKPVVQNPMVLKQLIREGLVYEVRRGYDKLPGVYQLRTV